MKVKSSYRFYRGCYYFGGPVFHLAFRIRVSGRENVPEGAAMVCANHSNYIDPILISLAFGIKHHVHYMAKVELFRIPFLSALIQKLGAISVNRDGFDAGTMKETLGYLKDKGKVAIFPEGTRVSEDDAVAAKYGAVKIADRAGVPIVPVHVPRKKRLFRKLYLRVGEPYFIAKQEGKRSADEYAKLADELMGKIRSLGDES